MNRKILACTASLILLAGVTALRAQGGGTNFPMPFGPNNLGKEFYFAMPANWDLPGSTAYYIRLYITSPVATDVTVWTGPSVKKVIRTIPNDVVTVDLTAQEAQMFVRTDISPVPNDALYLKRAVHVVANDPVIIYAMNRTTYSSDGLLLLPVNGLGRNYVVASYAAVIGATQELPSQYLVIAPHDSTQVTIMHPHRTPNHQAGETFTITMNKGDVYSAMTIGYNGDMSGATITASKPVAVTAGQSCTYIPNLLSFCCCDHLTEMMLPAEAWGTAYLAVPFATRTKGEFYRVFAREANTLVYVNGMEYATLTQSGGEEGVGWFEYRALNTKVTSFTANKPIDVFQYNPSQFYDNVPSDPFYMALTPVQQYAKEMYFCTPSADFPRNYLNIVCEKSDLQNLEITPAGQDNWQQVTQLPGMSTPKEFIDEVDGRKYIGFDLNITPGTYRLRSDRPFAAYVYGFDAFDSYGYPVGAITSDLDVEDTTAPGILGSVAPCSGEISGTATSKAEDDGSVIPLSDIVLSPQESRNYRLELTGFKAGVSTESNYVLKPVDNTLPGVAVVAVSDIAGNVSFYTFNYTPGSTTNFQAQADAIVFASIYKGTTSTSTTVLHNNSATPVTITSIVPQNGGAFTVKSPALPLQLSAAGQPGSSVDVVVEFAPADKGTFTDSLLVSESCGATYKIALEGQADEVVLSVPGENIASMISSMNLSPNPATGNEAVLAFRLDARARVAAVIVDAAGKEVRSAMASKMMDAGDQSLKLDLAGIAAGAYFVRITSDGRSQVVPFVIAR